MFGEASSSIVTLAARCWRGRGVHAALGWCGACHLSLGIPFYYVFFDLRQTTPCSVTHKSTRTFQSVFSSELEMFCCPVRIRSQIMGLLLLGHVRRKKIACEQGNIICCFNTCEGWSELTGRKGLFPASLYKLQTLLLNLWTRSGLAASP